YLTAKSVDEGRRSLMMNAVLKVPLQFGILLVGVLVFVFYHYQRPPMIYDPVSEARVAEARPAEFGGMEERYLAAFEERRSAAEAFATGGAGEEEARRAYVAANDQMREVRSEAVGVAAEVTGTEGYNDINFLFPRFVTSQLPIGIIGLFIAA